MSSHNEISAALHNAKANSGVALVPFFTAGYPCKETFTKDLLIKIVLNSIASLSWRKSMKWSENNLMWGKPQSGLLLYSHQDGITQIPPNFNILGSSEMVSIEAIEANDKPIWGFQTHLEATESFVKEHNLGNDGIKEKKVALVGVSSGRAGNLRGLDHLSALFHHLRAEVYSSKPKLSVIHKLFNDKDDVLDDSDTLKLIQNQINGFLTF